MTVAAALGASLGSVCLACLAIFILFMWEKRKNGKLQAKLRDWETRTIEPQGGYYYAGRQWTPKGMSVELPGGSRTLYNELDSMPGTRELQGSEK